MSIAGQYLERFAEGDRLIGSSPAKDLKYIVVIPAYNESGLNQSLDSLFNTIPPGESIEILVVINWPANAPTTVKKQNLALYHAYRERYAAYNRRDLQFHFILAGDLPVKFAGAGLARKTGMDEAIRRFEAVGQTAGIILSFDADTTCEPGYFREVSDHFKNNPGTIGCSLWFEHPLSGNEFEPEVYRAVTYYELHMRYYLRGLREAGHPNVFHTVGSAFAVTSESYCRQGGMNRKKAGEDFYFLQKLFDAGHYSECNSTTVRPSPRPSNRVIFGTGPSIREYLASHREPSTFNPLSFRQLKAFLENTDLLFRFDDTRFEEFMSRQGKEMHEFLLTLEFREIINEINQNSSTAASFQKRLLRWFNMFRMLKFLNYCKKNYPDIPVTIASRQLMENLGNETDRAGPEELLKMYREKEKRGT